MVAHGYDHIVKVHSALKKALYNGEITEERVDESVKRILQKSTI